MFLPKLLFLDMYLSLGAPAQNLDEIAPCLVTQWIFELQTILITIAEGKLLK